MATIVRAGTWQQRAGDLYGELCAARDAGDGVEELHIEHAMNRELERGAEQLRELGTWNVDEDGGDDGSA